MVVSALAALRSVPALAAFRDSSLGLSDEDASKQKESRPPLAPQFLLQPRSCAEDAPFLLRVVFVRCEDETSRAAVRETWASEEKIFLEKRLWRVRTVFAVGLPRDRETVLLIWEEAREKRDVLMLPSPEDYSHLAVKTAGVLDWTSTFCAEAEFLMKIDADVLLLREDKIIRELIQRRGQEGVALGAVLLEEQPVVRDPNNKNREAALVYQHSLFPIYAAGALYVLSRDVVAAVAIAASASTRMLKNEDAFVGLLLYGLGVQVEKLPLQRVRLDFRASQQVQLALERTLRRQEMDRRFVGASGSESQALLPIALLEALCALSFFDVAHAVQPFLLRAVWLWRSQPQAALACVQKHFYADSQILLRERLA